MQTLLLPTTYALPALPSGVRRAAIRCHLLCAGLAATLLFVSTRSAAAQSLDAASYVGNAVNTYDAGTGAAGSNPLVAGLNRPIGLEAAGNTLYVANSGGGTVNAYNATTGAAASGFATISTSGNPFDVAVNGNLLYVSSRGGNTVRAYDALTGAPATAFPTITADLNAPTGLAVSTGVLYVANRGALTVRTYDAATGALLNPSFLSGVNTQFLTISGNVLYVSQSSGVNTVSAYNLQTGSPLAGFTTITGLSAPQGMEVVGNNLFVANYGTSSVREYDAATGALLNAGFITGVSGPYGLALVVPEPSTWGMIVGGAGLLAVTLRRRWHARASGIDPSFGGLPRRKSRHRSA